MPALALWQRARLLVLAPPSSELVGRAPHNPPAPARAARRAADLLTPQESFAAISNRLLVGPVVQTLVYSKVGGQGGGGGGGD